MGGDVTSLDAARLLTRARPDPDADTHAAELLAALEGFRTPRRDRPRKERPVAAPNARCRACGQPVLIATTAAGRRQPLDPNPDPSGNTAVYRDAAGTWRARVPTSALPAHPWEKLHTPHPATCSGPPAPAAAPVLPDGVASLAEHRKRKKATR